MQFDTHEYWMRFALEEARKAADLGEIPVGAVVVAKQQIIAKAHNQTETLRDVTAHAEILAITAAANALGAKYLRGCQIYITLEPCAMCAGALYWAQPEAIIIGAEDPKRGCQRHQPSLLHPKTNLIKGVLATEAQELLQDFFQNLRN